MALFQRNVFLLRVPVRKAIVENDLDALKRMLPAVTQNYLSSERGRAVVEKLIHEHKKN